MAASEERTNASSLARGAAAITIATAISRVTGFVRVVAVAAAMGTTFLANTYQTANTAPNVVFELVAAGVLTSVFVPTFVEYLVRGEREEGWDAANALASVALVGLIGLGLLVAFAAPLVMRVLTIGVGDEGLRRDEIALGSTFLRLFAPQIVFYGAGMIMTGALQAHRRFAMPAIAPIFNNVVVIAVYVTYAAMRGDDPAAVGAITTGQTWVLGAGTTVGVVAMTACLVPQLRKLGWRMRFRFQPSHPAVRRGARLGVWALSYAGGYQAGLIVVLVLANRVQGGVAAYQWAYTFFYLPYALFAVPIFSVLFTAMSEHAALGEHSGLRTRLDEGLRMMAFVLIPTALAMLIVAGPLARITLDYGVMSERGAALVARVMGGFLVGLPVYAAFLILTRAFYALGNTRTPALVNAVAVLASSAIGAALFFAVPDRWSVAGLAVGHSLGFAVGAAVLFRSFADTLGRLGDAGTIRALWSALAGAAVAGAVMVAARALLPESSRPALIANIGITLAAGAAVYVAGMTALRSPEMAKVKALVTRRA
ncbi:MAG TPA: murein biosynthesis integral membrane protein MurJ [Actinomycetota bacterium]